MGQAERATDRQHGVAGSHGVDTCQSGRLEIVGRQFEYGQIGAGIGP